MISSGKQSKRFTSSTNNNSNSKSKCGNCSSRGCSTMLNTMLLRQMDPTFASTIATTSGEANHEHTKSESKAPTSSINTKKPLLNSRLSQLSGLSPQSGSND